MISLILAILFSAAFAHIMRYGQSRKQNMLWIGPANYWTASLLCLLAWIGTSHPAVSWDMASLGLVAGASFCAAYFLINAAIKLAGVGVAQSMGRLSVALPVVASIVVWNERPSVTRSIGLGLALIAIPLLTRGRGMVGSEQSKWKALILLGNFLALGIAGVAMKAYSRELPAGEPAFLTLMFLTAAIGSQAVAITNHNRPAVSDVLVGAALGVTNVIANYGTIHALATLPGIVVFPTLSAATIVVTAVCAAIFWGERYTRIAKLGMAIAIAALILINV